MMACAIYAHARPQGHYQVGEGQQTQQVQKYVQEMSLAPIGDPAERKKRGRWKVMMMKIQNGTG